MAFRPDPQIRQQILVLLNLWKESVIKLSGKKKQRKMSLSTTKFLEFLLNTTGHKLSYDLLRQYVDNDSSIQGFLADFNRNSIVLNDPDSIETPAEELPAEEVPTEETPAEEPPDDQEPAPAPPVAEPEEQEKITQNRKNVIAAMAARARKRRG
jgi:outer membrane biosynthesis protein TonB